MQKLWLMARASSCAVLSKQAFLQHPLPAHTTARSVLTCNLEPLFPCTHRSYIVLLGLSYFLMHVLHDPVSEHHCRVIHSWTYSMVAVPEVLCAPIHMMNSTIPTSGRHRTPRMTMLYDSAWLVVMIP